jgi:hypothetical protein
MPIYEYQHNDTGEVRPVYRPLSEYDKEYCGDEGNECGKWKKIVSRADGYVKTKLDPYNKNDFVNNLHGKNYTMGDLWDASKELSEKRAEKEGVDPVKQKYYDEYSAKRNGQKHPNQIKEETAAKLKEQGIEVKVNR